MSLKTIREVVGEGGANIPADVAIIQYLLNCVPVSEGGPLRKLKIDGFAGVITTEATNRFQKIHFGWSKSRVEPGEQTLNDLKRYDPLPFSAPVVTPDFQSSTSEKMDPSRMNRVINKSIEGGGIKARLYEAVNDTGI